MNCPCCRKRFVASDNPTCLGPLAIKGMLEKTAGMPDSEVEKDIQDTIDEITTMARSHPHLFREISDRLKFIASLEALLEARKDEA